MSSRARRAIASTENQILISAASAWELAIKNRSGKLEIPELLAGFDNKLMEGGMLMLPISVDHAVRAGSLPEHHKDPFDRMLVAQAQAENLAIISNDHIFDRYGVRRVW
jgi:PIN domain nuclease of toxin-antitoxin system